MGILKMNLIASVMIVLIIIIRTIALHKFSKRVYPVLWGLVMLRLIIPFSIPSKYGIYSGVSLLRNIFAKGAVSSITTDIALTPTFIEPLGTKEFIATTISNPTISFSLIKFVWLVGLVICMGLFAIIYFKCIKKFKRSLPIENDFIAWWQEENPLKRTVLVRESSCIKTPLVYGVFKPIILFPRNIDWNDEKKLKYVLAHEYTHIRRFDTLTKLILTITVCINWFNPFVWIMYMLANRDIELSCDEIVLGYFDEAIRSDYALTLLGLEEEKIFTMPLVNQFSRIAIEERIIAIMKTKKITVKSRIVALVLVLLLATAFTTSAFASTDVQEKKVKTAEQIVDFDENDINLTFSKKASTETFTSYTGIVEEEYESGNGFDFEKAISDIKSGKIKPLTLDALPKGVSKDGVMSFEAEDGSGENITMNNGATTYANCAHTYTPGIFSAHAKAKDGSCSISKYDAIRCYKCNTIWVLEKISTTNYRVCPH